MSRQMKGAGLAAAGLALCGGYQAFVPGTAGQRPDLQSSALRGADIRAEQVATAGGQTGLPMGLVGVLGAGAAGALAIGRSDRSRVSAVARRVATVGDGAEAPPPPFDPSKQLGVTAPLGFFDPLGFCKVGDEEGFRRLRIAEIKHGRVAMMAAVGAVVQPVFPFPGFEKVPSGIGAVLSEPGAYGFAALFVLSGVLELVLWKDDASKSVASIGDYGNPFQFGLGDPVGESDNMRNRELNNGRAAMFAALGIIVAELATGKNALEQLGL
jgi:hypothetical protein